MKTVNESPIIGRRQLKLPNTADNDSILADSLNNSEYNISSEDSKINEGATTSVFSRLPRDFIPFPKTEVEIQSPGDPISPPSSSLVPMLLPLAGTIIGITLSVLAAAGGSTGTMFLLVSVPITLFSIIGAIFTHKRDQNHFHNKVSQRKQRYRAYLKDQQQVLDKLVEKQRCASLIPNPSLEECLKRVEGRGPRLWERKAGDPDFLEIRLGIGSLSRTFEINPPSIPQVTQEPDDLFKEASSLIDSYNLIDGLAINLPLINVVAAGLIGPRLALIETTRGIIMQLATHHAPNEVKVVLILPEDEIKEWEWVRWLPHIWNNEYQTRFIVANDFSTNQILPMLEQKLKQRKLRTENAPTVVTQEPIYVFIFADQKVWKGDKAAAYGSLLDLLIKDGPEIGAYSIFLGNSRVPKDCRAIVNLQQKHAALSLIGPDPSASNFLPDSISIHLADRFARSLSSLCLEKTGESVSGLPTTIPLLQMLKVDTVEDLSIPERWAKNRLERSLSVPIGIHNGEKTLCLDLHEQATGPHGLLAGTSGSGKSELLQTLIASLALNFPPEKVAFILIDFKSLMVPPFTNLPHQVGIITNLEGNLATRALIGLEAEKERRQRLFLHVGKSSIDDYQELYFSGKTTEPLPHLFIIVDEFAELAVDHPDFINGLVSLSRVGRSLGFHLLLATQKPAGVVNETIWANSRTRLCLRVERPEDSMEVLKRPDAAAIPTQQKGRAYFQVGMNEIFEQFQVAWATAPYFPGPASHHKVMASIIQLDGTSHPLNNSTVMQPTLINSQNQLSAIVDHIISIRQKQTVAQPLKRPWLPPLEKKVLLKEHRISSGGWDGKTWQKSTRWLNPYVGEYDDPNGQTRGGLLIPLGRDGNLIIYGAPGSGKTTFIQTLITSLVLDHSPEDLHLYIMDFGGRSFKVFEALPHMGAIVLSDESERLHRLLQFLRSELDRRRKLLEALGGKINDYRTLYPDTLADILVILDNFTAFANSHNEQVVELGRLASEGGSLGMHLVITSNVVSAIPISLISNIQLAISLELVDPNEYISVVGRTNGITPIRGVAGRGLIKGSLP
jgi:DNA segregation ATPase FtsK/SpoIIIE, S-DNA-T family